MEHRGQNPVWTLLLSGLVFLVSTQHALRDPRTMLLPQGFTGLEICRVDLGSPHSSHHSSSPQQPQPHCPLCLAPSFSDGRVKLEVQAPQPVPNPLSWRAAVSIENLRFQPNFPLLSRGPPQI